MSTINTYVIYATHPTKDNMVQMQLIATSREAAISRTRGTLVHRERDVEWLNGLFHVATEQPGTAEGLLEEMNEEAVAAFATMINEAPSLVYCNYEFIPEV